MSNRPFGQWAQGRFRRRRVLNWTWRPQRLLQITEDATPTGLDGPTSITAARLQLDSVWNTLPDGVVDDFTRADSTTTLGNNWEAISGTWGIASNKAYIVSTGAGRAIQRISPQTESEFVMVNLSAAEAGAGVIISCTDADNLVYLVRSVAFATFILGKIVDGVNSTLVNTGSLTSFSDCNLFIWRNGTDYQAAVQSLSGQLYFTPVQSIPDVQGHGVGLYASATLTTTRFDAFKAGDWKNPAADTATGNEGVPQVGVSDSDTGSATSETESLVITEFKTESDTGSGSDSQSGARTSTETDAGSGTDSQSGVRTSTQTDTGAGTDAQSGVRTSTQTDTGAGVEGTPAIAFSQSDTGSGVDAQSGARTSTQADTGSATSETEVVDVGSVSKSDSDTGAGAEGTPTLSITSTQTDTGSGSDAESGARTSSSADTGSGTDAQSGARTSTQADTGSATAETESGARTSTQTDTGSGVEAQSGVRTSSSSDTATGTDAESLNTDTQFTSADTGVGADAESLYVTAASTDDGSGTESEVLVRFLVSGDTATGVEAEVALDIPIVDPPPLVDRGRRFGQGRTRGRVRTTMVAKVEPIARVRPPQEYAVVSPLLVHDPRVDEEILLLLS